MLRGKKGIQPLGSIPGIPELVAFKNSRVKACLVAHG